MINKIIHIIAAYVIFFFKSFIDKEKEIVAKKRIHICYSCDKFNNNTCTICGCNMKVKTLIMNESCPQRKWMPHEKN